MWLLSSSSFPNMYKGIATHSRTPCGDWGNDVQNWRGLSIHKHRKCPSTFNASLRLGCITLGAGRVAADEPCLDLALKGADSPNIPPLFAFPPTPINSYLMQRILRSLVIARLGSPILDYFPRCTFSSWLGEA